MLKCTRVAEPLTQLAGLEQRVEAGRAGGEAADRLATNEHVWHRRLASHRSQLSSDGGAIGGQQPGHPFIAELNHRELGTRIGQDLLGFGAKRRERV